ncbi:S26 family signal peptidase [Nonomuraea turkmeniaca]|uniref:S26 family signal peptidase n=1 Tax=Nonomuraea turkmeniaca TaxID=103838 RepID=A0A5S4FRA9_9ACTN|nr:S26 family signal peptidase [Nonomuraea turkmeniaca]TMR23242.1 S26 family signal peptidase [Nonomuraea turkmeniaca]
MTASILLATGCAAIALIALIVWLRRAYSIIRVDGYSMAPTLTDGDQLVARRVAPSALRNGHIAVVLSPLPMGGPFLIKRIVALPGDPVPLSVRPLVPDARVPDGQLILIGDNTDASFDSRDHGYFPIADVHAITLRKLTPARDPSRRESEPVREFFTANQIGNTEMEQTK